MPLLHNGDAFPPLSIAKVGGGTLKLPDDLKKVAAMSVDDEGTTAVLVEKHRIHFPVGFGAAADAVAAATGAYVNAEPRYLQSTGFVLDPQGKIVTAVYSSGAIGRLVPEDVAGLVAYIKSKAH